MNFLADEMIESLHRKYAPTPGVYELVYTHCQIVWRIAEQLIDRRQLIVDKQLVKAGCLLHDIGVYALYDEAGVYQEKCDYITHGIEGERILQSEGAPAWLCRIASHHTGVGLTKGDIIRQQLPLPPADYTAATIEERLVMYADKFHSKSRPPHFNSYEQYRRKVSSFGMQKAALFDALADEFGLPDLAPLADEFGHAIDRPVVS